MEQGTKEKTRYVAFLAVALALLGCAPAKPVVKLPAPPPQQMQAPVPLPQEVQPPLVEPVQGEAPAGLERAAKAGPGRDYLTQRLSIYQEKLSRWLRLAEQLTYQGENERPAGWYACLRQMEEIEAGYRGLLEPEEIDQSWPPASDQSGQPGIWEVTSQDVAFLESECEGVYKAGSEALSGKMVHPAAVARKLEVVVGHYVGNGRYEDALLAYRNLQNKFPDWQPSAETKQAYGKALLHTGDFEGASRVLADVLAEAEPCSPWALKRLTADLLLATGRGEEAKQLYQNLAYFFASLADDDRWVADQLALLETVPSGSEEMAGYQEVLRAFLAFDGQRRPGALAQAVEQAQAAFPESVVAEYSGQLLQQARERVDAWVQEHLMKADNLVGKKDFSQARTTLQELLGADLAPETKEIIRQTLADVDLAETREQERQQLRQAQDLASRWEEATYLVDLERYDEAISLLQSLLETEYQPQARQQLVEVTNRAASSLRRQAADLFIKAREAATPDQKMEFLVESRRLLKAILEKYPDADISNKVSRNLEVIDQQILELDPNFIVDSPPEQRLPGQPPLGL